MAHSIFPNGANGNIVLWNPLAQYVYIELRGWIQTLAWQNLAAGGNTNLTPIEKAIGKISPKAKTKQLGPHIS